MRKTNRLRFLCILAILALLVAAGSAFAQDKKGAAPKTAAPPDAYIIGPEDVLFIHIWKEDALSRTVPVRIDGKISLPLVDDIQAAGLTPMQLKAALTERLKDVLGNPTISVIVSEANSYKVYISGQIRTPGMFRVRTETSLLQLIAMVGGFTDWADQKNILIIRKDKTGDKRLTVNYKRIVDGDEREADIGLKPGDMVIVP